MSWLKDAWIDVTVTIVIVLATVADLEWARWAVQIYTPLMLVLWLSAYLRRYAQSKIKSKKTSVPPLVHHVLYGADVLFTAYDRWWWIAGCWALIWILSAATSRAAERGPKAV